MTSDHDRLRATLADLLTQRGHPHDVVVVTAPPVPGSPVPPEGPWVVVPQEGFAVGGVSRGSFRPYAWVRTEQEVVELVLTLLGPTAYPPVPAGENLLDRGRATSRAIQERTARRGGAAGPAELAPGDLLDQVGAASGHHLFALGTPFPMRSQPPGEVGGPYHRYEVRAPLSLAQEGVAAPWFEQPGGGAMVVLGYPVRWHLDQGELVELLDG
ncbi:TNT domain-containing protein [Ornithinimicrobium pratense]|uniref:TNT domain-containing protein n=1 Tax=Ornithinimicrobium pratense TaxID=2593973 RepID=A0A5J6V7Z5_9MICO|nr:TNT domain-containing protein [Ornithinimicrobium pratense]QFG69687.1 TNT domain-containing protein [Ornithinimicrobium pratense]